MRTTVTRILVVICAMLAWMNVADADNGEGGVRVNAAIGGGLVIPVGDIGDYYDGGPTVRAGVRIFSPTFPVGARVRGQWFRLKEPGSFLGTPRFEGNVDGYGAFAEGVLQPRLDSRLTPYVFGGFGVVSLRSAHTDNSQGTSMSSSESKGALSAGAGLELMWDSWGLFSEFGYQRIDGGNVEVTVFGAGAVLRLK